MPKVKGLAETAVFVQNLARARDFYQQILGLQMIEESDFGCVFLIAKGQLLLLVHNDKATLPSATPGGVVPACVSGSGQILGAGHIAFAIDADDIEMWRTCLTQNGVEVLSEVAWESGARSLYFRDPDGHLLEVATPGLWGLDW